MSNIETVAEFAEKNNEQHELHAAEPVVVTETMQVLARINDQMKAARERAQRAFRMRELARTPEGRKILAKEQKENLKRWEAERAAIRAASTDAERLAIKQANKQKRAARREEELRIAARKKAEQASQARGNG